MYGTLADFKTYCDEAGYDHSAFNDSVLTHTLNLASKKLDAEFRSRWVGYRTDNTQSLEFPRTNAIGSVSGVLYAADTVPTAILESTYELTFQMASGVVRGVVGDKNEATIKSEKKSLVSGMSKEVEYTSGLSPEDRENQVYESIASLYVYDLLKGIGGTGGFKAVKCL